MQRRVNLPALAIFVSLLLGSAIGGIAGAMVAIPTAVLVSVLVAGVSGEEGRRVGRGDLFAFFQFSTRSTSHR